MNLYIRLTTLKDRIKLRLMLDEAADLRRDLLHCQRGSEAWLALRGNIERLNQSMLLTWQRIAMRGYVGSGVASRAELGAVAMVALAAVISSYVVVAA